MSLKPVYELTYPFQLQALRDHGQNLFGYEPFTDPLTKKLITGWYIKHCKDEYSVSLATAFKNILGCHDIRPRFYMLSRGFSIPDHKDRGTACSINVLLSRSDPVVFDGKALVYRQALLNVQALHSVPASDQDRLVFKLSIFDLDFETALARLGASQLVKLD